MQELLVFFSLGLGVLSCLLGSVSFWRSSKLSSVLSEASLEKLVEENRSFKRNMTGEWEDAYHKLRSMAGRLDRLKRTMKEAEPEAEPPEPFPANGQGAGSAPSLAELNRQMLRARGINL